jgi:hypothetical protein
MNPRNRVESSLDELQEMLGTEYIGTGMMKSFFDESTGGSTAFSFAGYLGHIAYWRRFEREWRNVLLNFRPTLKQPFHMKEWSHPKIEGHQFSGWSKEKRWDLINRLLDVIYREPLRFFAYGCGLEVEAFNRMPEPARLLVHDDPYYLTFQFCIIAVTAYVDEHGIALGQKIGFVYDRRSGYAGKITEMYNLMKDSPDMPRRDRMADVVAFGSREEYPQLQAADILAYTLAEDLECNLDDEGHQTRYILKQITTRGDCKIWRFNELSLRLFWEQYMKDKGIPYDGAKV